MNDNEKLEAVRNVGYYHSPHTNVIYRFVVGNERNPDSIPPHAIAVFDRDKGVLTYVCDEFRNRYHSPVVRFMRKKWQYEAKEVHVWGGEGLMPVPEEPEPIITPVSKESKNVITSAEQLPWNSKQQDIVLEKPKEDTFDRTAMPAMPLSGDVVALNQWVKKWWPSVPVPPKQAWDAGDKTPDFVNWMSLYFSEQFTERYGVYGEGEIEEEINYIDSDQVLRTKKVKKKVLLARRKTNLTEKIK